MRNKKLGFMTAAITAALLLGGCGKTANETAATDGGKTSTVAESEIDVDLTALSSTMVYSEVYNMMVDPDSYIGKTVKMSGDVSIYQMEDTGNTYYSCIISDATACCAQGLEFELTDESTYPEENSTVTVSGTFETYEEDGYLYCHLANAVVL
jgi:hypothetical protein